jgi:hypothetical protein
VKVRMGTACGEFRNTTHGNPVYMADMSFLFKCFIKFGQDK